MCAILRAFLLLHGCGVLVDCELEQVNVDVGEDGALLAVRYATHAEGLGRGGRGRVSLLIFELQIRKNSLVLSGNFNYSFFCLNIVCKVRDIQVRTIVTAVPFAARSRSSGTYIGHRRSAHRPLRAGPPRVFDASDLQTD